MPSNNIGWFFDLISKDRINKNSSKRKSEIKELLYRFVDNCPSKDGPFDSYKFSDYGFNCGHDYSEYKQRIFKAIPQLKNNYLIKFSENNKKYTADDISRIYSGKKVPTIYFAKGKNGEIDSLFKKIRNAFAHGNYFKKGEYYIIWNEGNNHDVLSCFMMLKYSHLITIFDKLKV